VNFVGTSIYQYLTLLLCTIEIVHSSVYRYGFSFGEATSTLPHHLPFGYRDSADAIASGRFDPMLVTHTHLNFRRLLDVLHVQWVTSAIYLTAHLVSVARLSQPARDWHPAS
jgi:hypothetical protein